MLQQPARYVVLVEIVFTVHIGCVKSDLSTQGIAQRNDDILQARFAGLLNAVAIFVKPNIVTDLYWGGIAHALHISQPIGFRKSFGRATGRSDDLITILARPMVGVVKNDSLRIDDVRWPP